MIKKIKLTTKSFHIITSKKEWKELLLKIEVYDFYHTYDYHNIDLKADQTLVLLAYFENKAIIALPLLIQKIEGSNYYDATSVYGYAGPIYKNLPENFDNTNYINLLKSYFKNNNIIAVFSRLNPYIYHQNKILKDLGELTPQGKVVNIDLTSELDIQRQKYQSRLKTHVNKSRRNCSCKRATTDEEVYEFIQIYRENMRRVGASDFYFFEDNYFFKLFKSNDFDTEILLAKDKETGEIIAGAMFISNHNIIQYHLSGCKTEYLHLMPIKYLIDEMRLIATARKLKYFNLGGGLGSNNDDTLFKFKASFSKDFRDFYLWKLIVNKEIYEELVTIKNMGTEVSYFPKYRFSETVK